MKDDKNTPRSVLEILQQHGTMNFDFVATSDELRKPRDPKGIRKWLNVRRKKATPEEEILIWRKLFDLYGIPNDWPRDIQMQWLAGRLAAELFKRCQALWKPHGGGPTKQWRQSIAELREPLFQRFNAFEAEHPRWSRQKAAGEFIKENRDACAAAKLKTAKGFIRALQKQKCRNSK